MDFHWQSQLRHTFSFQRQNIYNILAFPSVKTLIHWWPCCILFFSSFPPTNSEKVIANRCSLLFLQSRPLAGVVRVCHLSLSHGAYLHQTITEKEGVQENTCGFNTVYRWLNQMGVWLTVLLLVTDHESGFFCVFPPRNHLRN